MIEKVKAALHTKVIDTGYVLFSSVFVSIVFLACGVFFLLIALFYEKVEPGADILLMLMAGVCFLWLLLYFTLVPILLIKYPKHKKLMYVFLKKQVFYSDRVIQLREKQNSR